MKRAVIGGVLIMAVVLAACGPSVLEPTPTPTIIRLSTRAAPEGGMPSVSAGTPSVPRQPAASPTATPTRILWAPLPTGIPRLLLSATPTPVAPTPTPGAATTPAVAGPMLTGRLALQMASGGEIVIVGPDGTPKVVTHGLDPAWSPDGRQIAFTRWSEPQGVYVVNADGSQLRLVYRINRAKSPTWSPDGSKIAFTWLYKTVQRQPLRGMPFGVMGGTRDYWRVSVINLSSGEKTDMPLDPGGHAFSPHWGPDGRLVYKGERGLFVTDEKGPPVQVTDDPWHWSPVWSPDGRRIAFMGRRHDHWEIGVVNSDGSGLTWLTTSPMEMFVKPVNHVAPVWSPDGRTLAFVSDRDGTWRVYVMNADGSGQRLLLDLPIVYEYAAERVLSWAR